MKYSIYLLLLVLLTSCTKQKTPIEVISLEYSGTFHPNFGLIKIDLIKRDYTILTVVKTYPNRNTDNCEENLKESAFVQEDVSIFDAWAYELEKFNRIDSDKAHAWGFDGSTWTIAFGGKTYKEQYTFWTPEMKTKERGLTAFYALGKEILSVSGIDTTEID